MEKAQGEEQRLTALAVQSKISVGVPVSRNRWISMVRGELYAY